MSKVNSIFKSGISANIGEWSELYALVFILVNGGIYGANKKQEKISNLFYKVLKVVFTENNTEKIYEFDENGNILFRDNNFKKILINKIKLREILPNFYYDLINNNQGRSFKLKIGEEALKLLYKNQIKASNSQKKDIELILDDLKTNFPSPRIGFSIKSQLGGSATLINASSATNFVYEILDKEGKIPNSLPNLHPKNVKENVQLLISKGFNIVFHKIESDVFTHNLALIDSNLAFNLSKILLSYYKRESTFLRDLLASNFTDNLIVEHKIKEFLSIMALGMMPNTVWDGMLTSLGGIILVKKDGDVLCYYLYNMKDFQSYLLDNTKLDTPSTSRYKIGQIINEKGRFFIKLNLQVRFTK